MENITQDQCDKDWDETREQVRKNTAENIKILKKFDDKYDTNLGQWYDNESDALDDNLNDEYQSETIFIDPNLSEEDEKTIDINSPVGPPNQANLELKSKEPEFDKVKMNFANTNFEVK